MNRTIKSPCGCLLTPEQARTAYMSLGAALRQASGRTGGRPKALAPCRYCGAVMGARERKAHEPECEERKGNLCG